MRHFRISFARWYLLALAVLLITSSGFAQGGKGVVSGRVQDTQGGVLQGAKIVLDPGGLTTVSDAQGEFTLNGVPGGPYTLTVSYIGLQTYTAQVEVKAGATTRADARLKVAAGSEQILVTAERASGEPEE